MTKEELFAKLLAICEDSDDLLTTDWWQTIITTKSTFNIPNAYDYLYYPMFYIKYDVYTWGDYLRFLNEHDDGKILTYHPHITFRDGQYKLKSTVKLKLESPFISIACRDSQQNPPSVLDELLGIEVRYKEVLSNREYTNTGMTWTTRLKKVSDSTGPDWLTTVNDYRFTPRDLPFLGGNKATKMFFGLELEISTDFQPYHLYHIVTNVEPKQDPFFYIKHDGSVTGNFSNSYEIVTFPCTPRYLKSAFRTFFKKLNNITRNSVSTYVDVRDVASNGLHIHVSKDAFFEKGRYSRLQLNKFATVWNQWDAKNSDFLQQLSRRTIPIEGSSYFAPHRKMRDRTVPYRLRNGAACEETRDRYASARETDKTIEVRIFQSRFDFDHVAYCIELTQAMFEYSGQMGIKDIGKNFKESFTRWLGKQNGYRYAKEGVFKCA